MAKLTTPITLGIDVAKDVLAIYHWDEECFETIINEQHAIKAYLGGLCGPVQLALEPTSHYHFAVVEAALALGMEVYLVNARQLAHYRYAVDARHKSDPKDAWLLARYLKHEVHQLRPFRPRDHRAQRLWCLILRRATIVRSRQQVEQSMSEVGFSVRALMTQYQQVVLRLDQAIRRLIRDLGWWADYRRCQSIPGIGPINAAALVVTYHRGAFSSRDAYVAYLGLDVRVRESGHYQGKRRLTKQGPSELRRLLYCASGPARVHARFSDYFERLLGRGLSRTAARVALSRKLARIAFALMRQEETFVDRP
jgi:transposase